MNVRLHASFRFVSPHSSHFAKGPDKSGHFEGSHCLRVVLLVPIPNKVAMTQNHKEQKLVKESNFQVLLLTEQHPCDTEFLSSPPVPSAISTGLSLHAPCRVSQVAATGDPSPKTPHCPTTDLPVHSISFSFPFFPPLPAWFPFPNFPFLNMSCFTQELFRPSKPFEPLP